MTTCNVDCPRTGRVPRRRAAIGGLSAVRRIHMTWSIVEQFRDRLFLVSDRMTIAHPYLFVMLTWVAKFEIEVS